MNVLITGAAGFIGFHVARRLLSAGMVVLGVDSLNDYYDVTLKERRLSLLKNSPAFSFQKLDVSDLPAVRKLFESTRPDVAIHLAAQAGVRYSLDHPSAYTKANVDGFLAVLEACRAQPVKHLIYASSSSVYGANSKVPFQEDDPVNAPVSLYAATKRANELMAETYAHLFGIPCTGLRFFTVYGPWGRPDMAYYSFTKAITEGRSIDVFNHGRLSRDFTYIDDVVAAIADLIEKPPAVGAVRLGLNLRAPHILYNVGNHSPVALSDFIAAIEAALGQKAQKRLLPMQAGDVLSTYADVQRLAAVTGFSPSTPLAIGIAKFVDWYRGEMQSRAG